MHGLTARDRRHVRHGRPQQIETRGLVRDQRIDGRPPEARDDGGPDGHPRHGLAREVHIEAPAAGVIGREGEPEQAAFAAVAAFGRQVDERRRQERPVLDDADEASLLDDELDGRVRRVLHHADRRGEAGHVGHRAKLRLRQDFAGHEQEGRCQKDTGRRPDQRSTHAILAISGPPQRRARPQACHELQKLFQMQRRQSSRVSPREPPAHPPPVDS